MGKPVLRTGRGSGFLSSCSAMAVRAASASTPVEKKPLNHFPTGNELLSFGTAGCNLACKFCQNWDMSKSREMDTLADSARPRRLSKCAENLGCAASRSRTTILSCSWNTRLTLRRRVVRTASKACRDCGLYVRRAARRVLSPLDAANIDLKAFHRAFPTTRSAAAPSRPCSIVRSSI